MNTSGPGTGVKRCCCCCCQVASVMSDSVQSHRQQPTRLPCPWDSPGKNAGVGCHFLLQCMKVKSESEVAQSCPTLSDPMDCSPPDSSIHGIFQARVLEWGAIAFSVSWARTSNFFFLTLSTYSPTLLPPPHFHVCLSLPNPYLPMLGTVSVKFPPFTQVLICWTPAGRDPISDRKIYLHQ